MSFFLLTKRGGVKGMLRVYHGTSYENGLRILDEGFKCEKKIVFIFIMYCQIVSMKMSRMQDEEP